MMCAINQEKYAHRLKVRKKNQRMKCSDAITYFSCNTFAITSLISLISYCSCDCVGAELICFFLLSLSVYVYLFVFLFICLPAYLSIY